MCKSILDKYRPSRLCEIVGQDEITSALASWVKNPSACAMLLSGESGTGKSATAIVLANELGCDPYWAVQNIPAGEQTVDNVKETYDHFLMTRPPSGGFKVLIVNECDRMNQAVEMLWLDRLEKLPDHAVIVFTTNEPGKLSQRFRDRCMSFRFKSDASCLDAGQWLVNRVWRGELNRADAPNVRSLNGYVGGHISFRRIMQSLAEKLLNPPPISVEPDPDEPDEETEVAEPEVEIEPTWRDGPCWYVVVRDGDKCGLVVGPFPTESDAEPFRPIARDRVKNTTPNSLFYRYAVEPRSNGKFDGKLNKDCGYTVPNLEMAGVL